jgi:hypothetical protein
MDWGGTGSLRRGDQYRRADSELNREESRIKVIRIKMVVTINITE